MFSQHSGGINISVNGALGNRCLSSTECCAEVKCHPLLCPITPGHVITENNCIFQLLLAHCNSMLTAPLPFLHLQTIASNGDALQ